MAPVVAASTVVAAAASSSVGASDSTTVKAFLGLKSNTLFASKSQSLSASNGSHLQCIQIRVEAKNYLWHATEILNFFLRLLSEDY